MIMPQQTRLADFVMNSGALAPTGGTKNAMFEGDICRLGESAARAFSAPEGVDHVWVHQSCGWSKVCGSCRLVHGAGTASEREVCYCVFNVRGMFAAAVVAVVVTWAIHTHFRRLRSRAHTRKRSKKKTS